MKRGGTFLIGMVALVLLAGCAAISGTPVRERMEENIKIPAGRIEGNLFVGVRYPFKVSVPPGWNLSTEYPGFLADFGYDKPGPNDKEQTELYVFNPQTKSNLQFDLTPADPYTVFSQQGIEKLTNMGTESLKGELEKDFGKGFRVDVGPTSPASLKGVDYAAKKFVAYTVEGIKREQGWIYGFTEPYQIFIFYMVFEGNEKEATDRRDIKTILDSFELLTKK
jgi:hypothetical protein